MDQGWWLREPHLVHKVGAGALGQQALGTAASRALCNFTRKRRLTPFGSSSRTSQKGCRLGPNRTGIIPPRHVTESLGHPQLALR